MNFNEMISSLYLILKKKALSVPARQKLKGLLKDHGIQTVIIRSESPLEYRRQAAGMLQDEFKVFIECDFKDYLSMKGELAQNGSSLEWLPVCDIESSPETISRMISRLPNSKEPLTIFIRNKTKTTDPKKIKQSIRAIMKATGKKNIKFFWDCGFVLCAFSEEALGYFIQKGSEIQFSCPSFIEIDDGLQARICAKLGRQGDLGRIGSGLTLMEAVSAVSSAPVPFQSFGVYQRCSSCPYFQKSCLGGCRADIITSFK